MYWGKITPKTDSDVAQLNNSPVVYDMPESAMMLNSATHILSGPLGFTASIERQTGLLGDGTPIPMMSYSLIEYLLGLDLAAMELLEVGAGSSTAFWSRLTKSVLSLETDAAWGETVRKQNLPNVDLRICGEADPALGMQKLRLEFDAIVIDPSANRYRCAKAGIKMLRGGGFIVLDNSDWYPNTTKLLRDADLIQIDFHDFRPMHHYRCATSLFLTPDFRPKPKQGRLPLLSIGGKNLAPNNRWDQPNG